MTVGEINDYCEGQVRAVYHHIDVLYFSGSWKSSLHFSYFARKTKKEKY